jgi:CRP/FNR family cyclic AMP-dependent transcriptional regulator
MSIEDIIRRHRFFRDTSDEDVMSIAVYANEVTFNKDELIFREGDKADSLYLITYGKVSLELSTAHRGRVIIQTIDKDDVLGVSWVSPPYRWQFDARALMLTRAIRIDAYNLRRLCDENNALGYRLMKKMIDVVIKRMQAVRLQLLEIEEM